RGATGGAATGRRGSGSPAPLPVARLVRRQPGPEFVAQVPPRVGLTLGPRRERRTRRRGEVGVGAAGPAGQPEPPGHLATQPGDLPGIRRNPTGGAPVAWAPGPPGGAAPGAGPS